jgi:hypothetical protein
MPPESQPRGGNSFQFQKGHKGKGKGKHKSKKGKGRGQVTKRSYDEDSTSLSSFSTTPSSATQFAKDNSQYWHRGYHPNPTTSLTIPSVPNATKPYCYCHFHGWNFSHRGIACRKLIRLGDQTKLHDPWNDSPSPINEDEINDYEQDRQDPMGLGGNL